MTPYNFFLKHAGYSYNPQTETKEQGRRRCAKALVQAKQKIIRRYRGEQA